ncbi:PE family protein [Nocardia testacea]|uniref:PE family protein n=1 Tax=Nocardia testacea TaxID=248551 RepID=UPI003C2AF078
MEYAPDLARSAGGELDALADRLETALRVDGPLLHIAPAGADEVSVGAAQTLSRVGDSYTTSGELFVHELRKLAAAVRAQAVGMREMEQTNADSFPQLDRPR